MEVDKYLFCYLYPARLFMQVLGFINLLAYSGLVSVFPGYGNQKRWRFDR